MSIQSLDERIGRVINTPAFEKTLELHDIMLAEFQCTWPNYGTFENLPLPYRLAIVMGEFEQREGMLADVPPPAPLPEKEAWRDLASKDQQQWIDLCAQHGEKHARRVLATKLRQAADWVEHRYEHEHEYPDVFGCQFHDGAAIVAKGEIMGCVSVTFSHLWGG